MRSSIGTTLFPDCAASMNSVEEQPVGPQTEELLVKRRTLLEKKVDQETERAKEFTRLKNKRGQSAAPCAL